MGAEPEHKPYEWAEELFSDRYEVAPKYRNLLAMLAASLMGNSGAAQHFYNQALAEGATDEEIRRVVQTARSTDVEVGDLGTNVKRMKEEMSGDRAAGKRESGESGTSAN